LNKFVALAALATVSAAIAAPASAATLVRVQLANKSDAQISSEIQAAAQTVCAAEKASGRECVESTVRDATRQLNNIIKARSPATSKAAARQEMISVVRVSLKGKTTEQIHAEIKIAAETVCKSTKTGFINRADYEACVGGAVRSAKAQLQAFNSAQAKQVASL
jgi:UrcA family protein